ncbi:MAG: DUF1353 domain-containing protein [Rhodobacteraceae bacterium]|nr:DUF1353 domain-containing protein [Paracoccaceae bacterium]MCY4250675.1 DUF1353 domain-containing protein [Paracoccaceae bacterium]
MVNTSIEFPNPYPSGYKRTDDITDFKYHNHLQLARLKDRTKYNIPHGDNYIVLNDYKVSYKLNGNKKKIIVPRGMLTDLASVPRIFRFYVGKVGPHLEAAIVHDWLYVAWQEPFDHAIPKKNPQNKKWYKDMRHFSDRIMLQGMESAVIKPKSWAIYKAIRIFGWGLFIKENPPPRVLSEQILESECL